MTDAQWRRVLRGFSERIEEIARRRVSEAQRLEADRAERDRFRAEHGRIFVRAHSRTPRKAAASIWPRARKKR